MHENLRTDAPVTTIDGDLIGHVKEIRGAYFKVDAPMARDYWLACEHVTGTARGVQVSFPKDQLDDNKVEEPAPV